MRIASNASLHESTVQAQGSPESEPEPSKRPRRTNPAREAALRLADGDASRIERQRDGSYIVKAPGYAR